MVTINQSRKLPPRFTPGNFKLKVKRSRTGRGLFAEESISKGACIIEYVGRHLSQNEAKERSGKYFFETGRGITIDGNIPANIARFINHSCRPNCDASGPRGHVFIRAIKKIKAGEELTYDYGEEYFDEYLSNGRCLCKKCVKQ